MKKWLPRIYGSLLITLIAWAFLHRLLVHTLYINPWKLNGMAMYVNQHEINIGVIDKTTDVHALIPPNEFQGDMRYTLAETMLYTETLGRWYMPDRLAVSVFENRKDMQNLQILVHIISLHPFTGMEQRKVLTYDYDRSFLERQ